jgi:hypothetical protein
MNENNAFAKCMKIKDEELVCKGEIGVILKASNLHRNFIPANFHINLLGTIKESIINFEPQSFVSKITNYQINH